MRAVNEIRLALLGQRGHLFAWAPVFLGVGIGLYFLLRREPPVAALWGAGIGAMCLGAGALRGGAVSGPLLWALALLVAGFALAGARAHAVAGPVLTWRYYGPVEGTVVGIDRSASDAVRLTLADVVLKGVAPADTPRRVRVSLHGSQGYIDPAPGLRVGLSGHLSAPNGPVEPGGFDFRRHAWFQRLGAVGYTRSPVLELGPPAGRRDVFAFRMWLSGAIQARMPADVAGFGAAVTTGDRSGIALSTIEALRISNLAHLLAISGLHMGLLAGFVFGAVRVGLALVPAVALRIPTRKVAAVAALVASAGYLMLSGGSVSTERAFVMTAVMLMAILFDRRALSLRAVAMAALVVLVLRPEALLGPGFQMSFAATTALVICFGWLRDREIALGPRWMRPVAAVFISSLVAGLATAPFAAAFFNQVAHYGLPANLVSVPVMGMVVVPSAVAAGLLAPLGLEQIGLVSMALGLRWILGVAEFVAGLEGARGTVPSPPGWVIPVLASGALVLGLWQGKARWAGVVVMVLALAGWAQARRPDVLIADSGALVGVMTVQGRALSKPRGQGFVARNWLENDGSALDQARAAGLWRAPSAESRKGVRIVDLGETGRLIHVQGKTGLAGFDGCDPADVAVFSESVAGEWPCDVYDPTRLKRLGAVAIRLRNGQPMIRTVREASGTRLWSGARRQGKSPARQTRER